MPRNSKLNWSTERSCWVSKYRGKRKRFPGGLGKSDREAYKAAKAAWLRWKADLDLLAMGDDIQLPADYENCIRGWEAVAEHARSVREDDLLAAAEHEIADLRVRGSSAAPERLGPRDFHPATLPIEHHLETDFDDYFLYGARNEDDARGRYWNEKALVDAARRRLDTGKATSEPESQLALTKQIDRFMEQKRRQVETGDLSATRVEMLQRHFSIILEHFDSTVDVTSLDSQSLLEFRYHCVKRVTDRGGSRATARDAFATFKQFLRWMYSTAEVIDKLPRNFEDRSLAIPVELKTPVTISKENLADLLSDCSQRTELYVLLGLNCGYRQKDISSLKPSEVDWSVGTITRKRCKTAMHPNTPLVTYQLWDRTFELLRHEGNRSGDNVLLTERGTPLVANELREDNHVRKADAIKSAIQRVNRRKDYRISMDIFRNTSATLLRANSSYATVVTLFLGQSPTSTADRHYAATPNKLLAQATAWLGKELGITDNIVSVPNDGKDKGCS
ncbi:hypothetical protein [Roseiconus lacunae]|uniref:Core-binding (CB) domain-containing protein n=1 Tax=Roseiconus lacunae TaxID=2605694 RepID=A0ABT7PT42_9BACT|nr:hypothetical protein [Roseiconus lacunae]MCD0462416.1 hypothetical protein [Roseiconus lacunae]MDM4019306.1 hypothetical protein [Roseiconus lacunae]